jgi:hypothetical protein
MPQLDDAEIIRKLWLAFEEWNSGGVLWKQLAAEWVRRNLEYVTQQAINERILQHIVSNGRIDQVNETREEYLHFEFHYDVRIPILDRTIYIEMVLTEHEMGPVVTVVNVHDV